MWGRKSRKLLQPGRRVVRWGNCVSEISFLERRHNDAICSFSKLYRFNSCQILTKIVLPNLEQNSYLHNYDLMKNWDLGSQLWLCARHHNLAWNNIWGEEKALKNREKLLNKSITLSSHLVWHKVWKKYFDQVFMRSKVPGFTLWRCHWLSLIGLREQIDTTRLFPCWYLLLIYW